MQSFSWGPPPFSNASATNLALFGEAGHTGVVSLLSCKCLGLLSGVAEWLLCTKRFTLFPKYLGTSANYCFSFFHNTGEVAGVFSVVGVVALVIVFFFLTSYIRERRARKLDREIDEAAAAAATAHAPDFDDYDFHSGGGGFGHYSETSHGTFNQPPLSHEPPLNNLADIPTSYEPYGRGGGGGAGAAGIGARGRSQRGGVQPDPYGAFANPPEQYEMYETRRSWHQGIPRGGQGATTYDLLQAAGLAGSDPYAATRKASTGLLNSQSHPGIGGIVRRLSQDVSATLATTENHPGIGRLVRSHSEGASAMLTTTESHSRPTPAPGYPGGQDTPYPPEKARHSALYDGPGGDISTMPPDEDEDAYDGYHSQPAPTLDNPHSPVRTHEEILDEVTGQYEYAPPPRVHEEPARASIADDEDYGYNSGRGMLRVSRFIYPVW